MSYWAIEIEAPSDRADWLAWTLAERLATAVEQQDQETLTRGPEDGVDLLIVRLEEAPTEEQLEETRGCLRDAGLEGAAIRTRRDDDDGWRLGWRAFFTPVEVAPGAVARPPWEPPAAGALDLVIDPGLAFGVGTHPTTRLAARALKGALDEAARAGRAPCRVLDQGCGSGILALLAAKMGHDALGVEIDDMATQSAAENLPLNGADEAGRLPGGGRARFEVGAEVPAGPFEVVVANIIAPVLIELAAPLRASCARTLILSGLLESQERAVLAEYPGWRVVGREAEEGSRAGDDWLGLTLRREGA
ncbi:MAG: methyltransferase domain-containing protein [Deltaproteobacteria bacterium]|nr:methyltransferase domain-containing protein [Deltaproteobacteria bacterium]